MVNENFIPIVNQQKLVEEIRELEEVSGGKEYQSSINKSNLSPTARSKIIKMYGGNYVSERGKEGYGPMPIEDALVIAGSQTILNKIRRDFPNVAELLEGNPDRTLGFLQKKGALSLYQGTDAFRVPCSHRDDYSKSGSAAGSEYRRKIDEYVSNVCSKGNASKHYEELAAAREVLVGYIHEEYYKLLPCGPSVGNTNTRSFKADISGSYNYGSTSQVVGSCMGGINVEDKRPASDVFMASFSGSPEIKVLILNLQKLRVIEDFARDKGIKSAQEHIKNKQPAYQITWDDL